jgi:hypothetical protein
MARSGQITVTTAGTAVTANQPGNLFALAPHPTNTGSIWIGNDDAADVTNANGFALPAGGSPVVIQAANLNQIYVDADTNGEKLCWLRLD